MPRCQVGGHPGRWQWKRALLGRKLLSVFDRKVGISMNATTQTMRHPGRTSAFRWIASASIMEAVVSIAIIALAIVGLAGVYSVTMAAIATIITGAAILIEGGAFERGRLHEGSGMSAQMLGAIAGIILGVLALMGVASITLLAVAMLVFGVTFLLGAAMQAPGSQGSMEGHLLLGLSVSVLGLLAVIGIVPVTLVLVGLLVLGAIGLFGGAFKGMHLMESSRNAM